MFEDNGRQTDDELEEPEPFTLNEFKGKKVSVYLSNSKHSQQSFAAPRS